MYIDTGELGLVTRQIKAGGAAVVHKKAADRNGVYVCMLPRWRMPAQGSAG